MEEIRIDTRKQTPEEMAEAVQVSQLSFKLSQTMPYTPEYNAILAELFSKNSYYRHEIEVKDISILAKQ